MIRYFVLPAAVVAAVALAVPGVARAQGSDAIHASPNQAAQLLFVAGDVRRLSRAPSGTVDVVLEKVLQQEYRDDSTLAPNDAAQDIRTLSGKLGGAQTSPATLAILPGNQRILAILDALRQGSLSPREQRALAHVADQALADSSASARSLGREFNAGADSVSTLLYGSFSPAQTLNDTWTEAAAIPAFGRARDALWQAASHESVFDGSAVLAANNPALQNDATRNLTNGLGPDGSLTVSQDDVTAAVRDGLQDIDARTTRAIADHRDVVRQCPGAGCQDYRDQASADGAAGRAALAAQQTAVTAAGGLLGLLDSREGAAVRAEGQASAQVAAAVNSYFAATDYNQYVDAAVDVVGLAATLSVAEVDPAAAINGVLNVVHDIVNAAVPMPDAQALILQGLQGVSKQLSAFADETAAQFAIVDTKLETISRQVSLLAGQLSAQLAEAQTQLTGLGNALADLQSSVDRLHSEIQRLLADTARNGLRGLISQSVGYQQINNGKALSLEQFAPAAASLFDNATATSLSETVLLSPLGFDAPAAAAVTDLDPSVNFFALFPAKATDAPSGLTWSPLTAVCPNGRCLPSPDWWAVSARAFAQLLLENRDFVTPAYLTQLDNIVHAGQTLDAALRKISANDDGANGTGSKLFNSALSYYDSWVGTNGDRASGAPALLQALGNERTRYLKTQQPAGIDAKGGSFVDPWGGAQQRLGDVDILGSQWLQNPPSFYPVGGSSIPDLKPVPELISRLPAVVQNAIRLDIGRIEVSWRATWQAPYPAPGDDGAADVVMFFRYTVPPSATHPAINDAIGSVEVFRPFTTNCADAGGFSAEKTFAAGWTGRAGCRNFADEFRAAVGGPNQGGVYSHDDSGFARTSADLAPLVDARLRELQRGSLEDLVTDAGGLTQGDGAVANNVQDAAVRVQGAESLVRGYVRLGLPQALATDDGLRGLLDGDDADALLHPTFDAGRAAPADKVSDQLVNYLEYTLHNGVPQSDPYVTLRILFNNYRRALSAAIGTYVKTGRASGQDVADGGRLDEGSPLVTSTIARLQLTRAVLADHLAHPRVTPTPATPATPAPPAGGGTPAPGTPVRPAAARARIVRAPVFRHGAVVFTVRCVTGTCRLTTTVAAGRRPVARRSALTLAAGRQRTVTVRLSTAGRRLLARRHRLPVTVRIALAGEARPLAQKRLTLR